MLWKTHSLLYLVDIIFDPEDSFLWSGVIPAFQRIVERIHGDICGNRIQGTSIAFFTCSAVREFVLDASSSYTFDRYSAICSSILFSFFSRISTLKVLSDVGCKLFNILKYCLFLLAPHLWEVPGLYYDWSLHIPPSDVALVHRFLNISSIETCPYYASGADNLMNCTFRTIFPMLQLYL